MAGDPWSGRIIDARYRVGDWLAAGAMGVVYRGERLGLNKPVAIKFLHQSALGVQSNRQRFDREAAAMSRLIHPNLVSVIDAGTVDDAPYLVMEYHPGITLRRAMRGGRMGGPRAAYIARQILAGLGSAHQSGVVHRDLKPANVLLVGLPGEDLVKILDFGLAKLIEDGRERSDLSVVAASTPGTPEYMSPEQARGLVVDARSDLYSLGVILFEMAAGRRPFDAEESLAILRMHVEDPPPPVRALAPDLSPQLAYFIDRALEKDRELRWQSAAEAGEALAETPEGSSAPLGLSGAWPVAGDEVTPPPEAAGPAAPRAASPPRPSRDRSSREGSRRDGSARDRSLRDSARREDAPRQGSPRHASPRDRSSRDSSRRARYREGPRPARSSSPDPALDPGTDASTQLRPRRLRRRRWVRPVFVLFLVVAASLGGLYAAQVNDLIDLGPLWPSWLPDGL